MEIQRGQSQLHLAKAKCLINIAMFSGCIIKVNIIDWNWNIDSRDNGKIEIAPPDSYFPRYTLLSESIISKEEIGNYQLLRQKMLNQHFQKYLIYDISETTLLQPNK